MWEALRPIAARMPSVVREHEILRVIATVQGKDPVQSAAASRREVLTWAQRRSGGRLPEGAWTFGEFEYLSGGRNNAVARIETETSDLWAIRAEDPDKTVPGRIWTTEVVIGLSSNQPPRLSARLLVSTPEESLEIEPHVPGRSCAADRRQMRSFSRATRPQFGAVTGRFR